jgi:hypothetical protein
MPCCIGSHRSLVCLSIPDGGVRLGTLCLPVRHRHQGPASTRQPRHEHSALVIVRRETRLLPSSSLDRLGAH